MPDDDVAAVERLKDLLRDCDARLTSLIRERGQYAEALMELELRRRFGAQLHRAPDYHLSDRHPMVQRKRAVTAMRGMVAWLVVVWAWAAPASAQIRVAWDANTEPEVQGYRVYLAEWTGALDTMIDVGPVTTYTFTAGSPGVRYRFVVSAYGMVDGRLIESPMSAEVSAVYPGAPSEQPSPECAQALEGIGSIVDVDGAVWTVVNTEFRRNGIYANNIGRRLVLSGGQVYGEFSDGRWVVFVGSGWAETNRPACLNDPPPPPVDCQVSEWSEWSAWSAWAAINETTEQRTRTRTRTITTQPANGGAACPVLSETETEQRPIAVVNPCVATPLVVTGIKWPSGQTGNRSGTWNSGTFQLVKAAYLWNPLRFEAMDVRGCTFSVVR